MVLKELWDLSFDKLRSKKEVFELLLIDRGVNLLKTFFSLKIFYIPSYT